MALESIKLLTDRILLPIGQLFEFFGGCFWLRLCLWLRFAFLLEQKRLQAYDQIIDIDNVVQLNNNN